MGKKKAANSNRPNGSSANYLYPLLGEIKALAFSADFAPLLIDTVLR